MGVVEEIRSIAGRYKDLQNEAAELQASEQVPAQETTPEERTKRFESAGKRLADLVVRNETAGSSELVRGGYVRRIFDIDIPRVEDDEDQLSLQLESWSEVGDSENERLRDLSATWHSAHGRVRAFPQLSLDHSVNIDQLTIYKVPGVDNELGLIIDAISVAEHTIRAAQVEPAAS